MATNRAQSNRNTVKPASQETEADTKQTTQDAGNTVVLDLTPSKGVRANLFTQVASSISREVAEKVTLFQTAKQEFAQAVDLYKQGDEMADEARTIANNAAVKLYQARSNNLASADEVSAILIDQFGAKEKKDGTPSKTPAGQGEVIRKRIVRAAQAAEYVNSQGSEALSSGFFAGLPAEDYDMDGVMKPGIKSTLDRMVEGEVSVFRAYDIFAEIKRDMSVRTAPAFNPKSVAAMVEALSEEGAADIIKGNAALTIAYTNLVRILNIVGEAAATDKAA